MQKVYPNWILEIEPRWCDETETSKLSGKALPTLRNERSAGRGIPYSKIGRSVRYLNRDIFKYMEDRKIKTEAA